MSGLTKILVDIDLEDEVIIKKVISNRVARIVIFSICLCALLIYAYIEIEEPNVMMLISFLFMIMLTLSIFFSIKDLRKIKIAFASGKKEIYSGIIIKKFSKEIRSYQYYSTYYYVAIESNKVENIKRKQKINLLIKKCETEEDSNALDEYQKLIEESNTNYPIKISFKDFQKAVQGSIIEFHCLANVYLGSYFWKTNSVNADLTMENFLIIKTKFR